jgi:hypothetical protein
MFYADPAELDFLSLPATSVLAKAIQIRKVQMEREVELSERESNPYN